MQLSTNGQLGGAQIQDARVTAGQPGPSSMGLSSQATFRGVATEVDDLKSGFRDPCHTRPSRIQFPSHWSHHLVVPNLLRVYLQGENKATGVRASQLFLGA